MRFSRVLAHCFLLFALALAAAGCSSDSNSGGSYGTGPSPGTPPPNTVLMSGMTFTPATLTVAAGTTVTWKNDDSMGHTSTSNTAVWNTGTIAVGGTATTTFNTAGTFPYHCGLHAGMNGTIVVQ